jgi:hypothetical protein
MNHFNSTGYNIFPKDLSIYHSNCFNNEQMPSWISLILWTFFGMNQTQINLDQNITRHDQSNCSKQADWLNIDKREVGNEMNSGWCEVRPCVNWTLEMIEFLWVCRTWETFHISKDLNHDWIDVIKVTLDQCDLTLSSFKVVKGRRIICVNYRQRLAWKQAKDRKC